jgi:hypothetical protein
MSKRPQRFAAILAMILAMMLVAAGPVMAVEEPAYSVTQRDGAYELREYPPYLIAETRVEAGFMEAGNIAFGRLFRYISGANTARAEIAMTAPVEQAPTVSPPAAAKGARGGEEIAMTAPVEQAPAGADGTYTVGFIVPAKFSASTVPQPTDPRVSVRAVPARKVAVWRYSGRWTQENFREHEALLRARLKRDGIAVPSEVEAVIARYDAPFMPWFMRRNEVHLELARRDRRREALD